MNDTEIKETLGIISEPITRENILDSMLKILDEYGVEGFKYPINGDMIKKEEYYTLIENKEFIFNPIIKIINQYRGKCPKCGGIGVEFRLIEEGTSSRVESIGCLLCKKEEYNKRLNNKLLINLKAHSQVPTRYLKADMNNFPGKYKTLYSDILNKKQGLYLYGDRGTGKTHLMAALIKKIALELPPSPNFKNDGFDIPYHLFPLFITVPRLLLQIRECFKDNEGTSEAELIKELSEKNILFLDDIGAEKTTEWVEQTLYLIIDYRYSEEKATIISSNLTIPQLSDKLGDRIASRIAGMCKIIKMGGKDRRILGN